MATASLPRPPDPAPIPSGFQGWSTDHLSDEALRAIRSCRKHGKAAARSAWQAGAYLSTLHDRLVKGRRWAGWLRDHRGVISEESARRYILLYERTGGVADRLDGLTLTEAYAHFDITKFTEAARAEPAADGGGQAGLPAGQRDVDHRIQSGRAAAHPNGNGHSLNAIAGAHVVAPGAVSEGPEEESPVDPEEIPTGLDEEAILRAAEEIRRRRAEARLPQMPKPFRSVPRPASERKARIGAARLIHGDCRETLKTIPDASVDVVITDPPYPEVEREYGRISEGEWHDLMRAVVGECRRILKPRGSAVFILQPNYEKLGRMRLWAWEFLLWAGKHWGLVQDAYWWAYDAMPLAGTGRKTGLMRSSVKLCVWLGDPGCYRCQENVLRAPSGSNSARDRSDMAMRTDSTGRRYRNGRIAGTADERGGTTPFNLLPVAVGAQGGTGGHPAATPYAVAEWWCRYLLPPGGVLLDPFCGSGTTLVAGLDCAASEVTGIDKESGYLEIARKRVTGS